MKSDQRNLLVAVFFCEWLLLPAMRIAREAVGVRAASSLSWNDDSTHITRRSQIDRSRLELPIVGSAEEPDENPLSWIRATRYNGIPRKNRPDDIGKRGVLLHESMSIAFGAVTRESTEG